MSYHSVIESSWRKEIGQFEVSTLFEIRCGQVLRLHGLAEMVVEEVENPVSVDKVLHQGQEEGVTRRPQAPGRMTMIGGLTYNIFRKLPVGT